MDAEHQEHGETWRTLRVAFPPEIDTHCKEQVFFAPTDKAISGATIT
jgi:hypothetical protein